MTYIYTGNGLIIFNDYILHNITDWLCEWWKSGGPAIETKILSQLQEKDKEFSTEMKKNDGEQDVAGEDQVTNEINALLDDFLDGYDSAEALPPIEKWINESCKNVYLPILGGTWGTETIKVLDDGSGADDQWLHPLPPLFARFNAEWGDIVDETNFKPPPRQPTSGQPYTGGLEFGGTPDQLLQWAGFPDGQGRSLDKRLVAFEDGDDTIVRDRRELCHTIDEDAMFRHGVREGWTEKISRRTGKPFWYRRLRDDDNPKDFYHADDDHVFRNNDPMPELWQQEQERQEQERQEQERQQQERQQQERQEQERQAAQQQHDMAALDLVFEGEDPLPAAGAASERSPSLTLTESQAISPVTSPAKDIEEGVSPRKPINRLPPKGQTASWTGKLSAGKSEGRRAEQSLARGKKFAAGRPELSAPMMKGPNPIVVTYADQMKGGNTTKGTTPKKKHTFKKKRQSHKKLSKRKKSPKKLSKHKKSHKKLSKRKKSPKKLSKRKKSPKKLSKR
jgi:hypothetical protein